MMMNNEKPASKLYELFKILFKLREVDAKLRLLSNYSWIEKILGQKWCNRIVVIRQP